MGLGLREEETDALSLTDVVGEEVGVLLIEFVVVTLSLALGDGVAVTEGLMLREGEAVPLLLEDGVGDPVGLWL